MHALHITSPTSMYPLSLLHDPWSITDPWKFLWSYVAGLLPYFLCLKYVLRSEMYIAIIKFYITAEVVSWEMQKPSQRGWGQWKMFLLSWGGCCSYAGELCQFTLCSATSEYFTACPHLTADHQSAKNVYFGLGKYSQTTRERPWNNIQYDLIWTRKQKQ